MAYEPERRAVVHLDDNEIKRIAEAAAEEAVKKVLNEFYASVGKGIIFKILTWVGILVVVVSAYWSVKGLPKLP